MDKKIKLVRVVLFLDWNKRHEWKTCLENAAEKNNRKIKIGDSQIPLYKEENGKRYNYTGQFPQYSLKSNGDANLFNDEIWRFIEFDDDTLIDSYVYFCHNMRRVDQFFEIKGFKYTQKDKIFDGGFNCEYTEGILRGIPLPLPEGLECRIEKKESNYDIITYVRFHHGWCVVNHQNFDAWNVIYNESTDFIKSFFRHLDVFSSIHFLRKARAMRKIIIMTPQKILDEPHEGVAYNCGFKFFEESNTDKSISKTVSNKNYSLILCTNNKWPDSLSELLDKDTVVYVHEKGQEPDDAVKNGSKGFVYSFFKAYGKDGPENAAGKTRQLSVQYRKLEAAIVKEDAEFDAIEKLFWDAVDRGTYCW